MKPKIVFSILASALFISSVNAQNLGLDEAVAGELYAVYSGLEPNPGGTPVLTNIFVLKGTNDTVWLFGSGCGNRSNMPGDTSDVKYYRFLDTGSPTWDCTNNAIKDAQSVDTVITTHFGLNKNNVKLQFIVPHAHADHSAPEFLDELNNLGYSVANTNVYVHIEGSDMIGCTQPCCGYTPCQDRFTDKWYGASYNPTWPVALLNNVITIGQVSDGCDDVLKYFSSNTLGIWKVMSGVDTSVAQSHTGGTIDLVNDTYKWHIVGSNLSLWTQCTLPDNSWTYIDIHDYLPNLSTAIAENSKKNSLGFTIYPNPVKETITIRVNEDIHVNNMSLAVYNVLGMKMIDISDVQHELIMSRKELPAGVYLVSLKDGYETIEIRKLILK